MVGQHCVKCWSVLLVSLVLVLILRFTHSLLERDGSQLAEGLRQSLIGSESGAVKIRVHRYGWIGENVPLRPSM